MRKSCICLCLLLPVLVRAHPAWATDGLLILAPDDFLNALDPLARFKNASARPTSLVGLNWVYASFTGVDEPEQIKRCIAYYEENYTVRYVLLVGDVDKFPVRWGFWGRPGEEAWGMNDLYYADLYKEGTRTFETWDYTGNGLYAEIEFDPIGTINNDRIDYLPDVAVGRIPASNVSEVTAYVNKVIGYELRTQPSDAWFERAGLYTGTWAASFNDTMDQIAQMLVSQGFSTTKRYTDYSHSPPVIPPGVPDVIRDDLNTGLGFAVYIGHGSSDCWDLNLCRATLDNVQNTDQLPIVIAASCYTAAMAYEPGSDQYVDAAGGLHCGRNNFEIINPGPYPHPNYARPAPLQKGHVSCDTGTQYMDRVCLGETFTFGSPPGSTGAIAYLGQRTGGKDTAPELAGCFVEGYLSRRVLGDMWKYGLDCYYTAHNLADSENWHRSPDQWPDGHVFGEPGKFLILGDPSLCVGGAFLDRRSGVVCDLAGGPWGPDRRYRIVGEVVVPDGCALTVAPGTSILVEDAGKLTGRGASANQGLLISGTANRPVSFLSIAADPQAEHVVQGMIVGGELRVRNGGQIRRP